MKTIKQEIIERFQKDIEYTMSFNQDDYVNNHYNQFLVGGEYSDDSLDIAQRWETVKQMSDPKFIELFKKAIEMYSPYCEYIDPNHEVISEEEIDLPFN